MKKIWIWTIALLLCVSVAVPAMAASVFAFTEKALTLFEGESAQTALRREGNFDGDGEITYTSSKDAIATVDEDGTITAVSKGQVTITAMLKRDGRQITKAQATVKVLRPVQKVTLNTNGLTVYDPLDDKVSELLREETAHQVLVLTAGGAVKLAATCTPEDASSRKVIFESTDAGVAKVMNGTSLKAMQAGECDLVISSAQNPEVKEVFRVLVIQPVTKVQVTAEQRTVAAGSTLQLTANCEPENAAIKDVTWSSKTPAVATVDENGVVTGVKKGSTTIIATAADGSKRAGSLQINVTQPVTAVKFSKDEFSVNVGRTVQTRVTVEPASASDKGVTWSSSDEAIATVRNGVITGVKAGTCTITGASRSNPDVTASVTVTVNQPVTKIECLTPAEELNLRVGETRQLSWRVYPDDVSNETLAYKTAHRNIVTVDENSVITAVSRGITNVIATAQDGSGKQGSVKVNVIQPVTGVTLNRPKYYIQYKGTGRITATVEPSNANHQNVYWTSDDEGIATARSSGSRTGLIYGVNKGTTYVTATTEDGGFTATTEIWVDDFNGAVAVDSLNMSSSGEILIQLRNMTRSMTFGNVYFTVECFDTSGNPLVCNTDGVSTSFEGTYPSVLGPMERSGYRYMRFKDYSQPTETIGAMRVTITDWYDSEGYRYTIPEECRVPAEWPYFDTGDGGVG